MVAFGVGATFDHIDLDILDSVFRMTTSDRSDSQSASLLALCKDMDTELMSECEAFEKNPELPLNFETNQCDCGCGMHWTRGATSYISIRLLADSDEKIVA